MNKRGLLDYVASELHTMICIYDHHNFISNDSFQPMCICGIPEFKGIEGLMLPFIDVLVSPITWQTKAPNFSAKDDSNNKSQNSVNTDCEHKTQDSFTTKYYHNNLARFRNDAAINMPKFTQVNDKYIYATIFTDDSYIIIGPCLHHVSSGYLSSTECEDFKPEEKYPLTFVEDSLILKLTTMLHNCLNDDQLLPTDLVYVNSNNKIDLTRKTYTKTTFINQEYEKKHISYMQERREFNSIRDGDVERLRKSWYEDKNGEIGALAETPLRDKQNYAIMIITLASRYAIEGGLESEIAYTLAESYIMRVEKCGHPQTAEYIAKEAEMEYARLVHELHEIKKSDDQKAHKNPIIQECKDYICTHLHGKITVSELANELHVSESYLSSLFKKTDGRSIVEYINQHKVQLVKNLLIYSDYSFIDIANYLGFCSQSHLGAVFKAETGTTLSRYRRSNANRGFDKQIS